MLSAYRREMGSCSAPARINLAAIDGGARDDKQSRGEGERPTSFRSAGDGVRHPALIKWPRPRSISTYVAAEQRADFLFQDSGSERGGISRVNPESCLFAAQLEARKGVWRELRGENSRVCPSAEAG
jgi:hypothetical protein